MIQLLLLRSLAVGTNAVSEEWLKIIDLKIARNLHCLQLQLVETPEV